VANSPRFDQGTTEAAVDAVAALLDSGYLRIYSGSQPAVDDSLSGTLLAELTFGSTAFAGASSSGGTTTATANAITSDSSANASGTAGYHALVESDGTTVVGTGSVGTSGADLNMDSLSVTAGTTVSCSSYTISQSQS